MQTSTEQPPSPNPEAPPSSGCAAKCEGNALKELFPKTILASLNEAYGGLAALFARIQFIVFGEVEDECVKCLEASVARDDQRHPLTERELFFSLFVVYQQLNVAWNARDLPEERVRGGKIYARLSQFPDGAVFRDLWPAPSRRREGPRAPFRGPVAPNSLQAAFLQMAVRKLNLLRFRVASEAGEVDGRTFQTLRNGLPEHFTEEEFAHRLHRIYGEMNTAWACRRDAATPVSRSTWLQRRRFPTAFLSEFARIGTAC